MRRPNEFRRHVEKNGKGPAPDGWAMTAAEQRTMTKRVRARPGRSHRSPLWALLWAMRLTIALLVLVSLSPYVHEEDLSGPLARLFNYRLGAPLDPGDRNGLLHK